MLVEVCDGHGLEGARPDVEHEVEGVVAARLERRQEFGREVQSRGRRGGGAGRRRIGIHGLVARRVIGRRESAVFACFDDIRWQREFADAVGELIDGLAGGQREAHAVFAVLRLDRDGVVAVDGKARCVRGALTRA